MKHFHYPTLNSTQTKLKELLESESDHEYLVVSTDHQTQGQGRHLRQWESVPGGLYLSLCLPPANTLTLTSLELSVLLCRFFKTGLKVKWPNDVLDQDNQKCAGILIDVQKQKLIAGIGVNIMKNAQSSQEHNYGLAQLERVEPANEDIALELAQFIKANRLGDEEIIQYWTDLCVHLNHNVEVEEQGLTRVGLFKGIGRNGQALILIEDTVQEFYTGSLKIIF